jgi:phosphatidylinositol-3,4,5-trisphosphate 3-phosphatase/dual-specificity protein phosphatase PTEN
MAFPSAGRYRVYNLCSERAYEPAEFGGSCARYPFDDHNTCPLALVAAFCADVDAWLTAHPDNVAAVHCKAGKGRTGLMIAAYLLHCGFSPHAEAALRYFGVARTANGKGVTIPSQMRYVHYYEQVLRHGFPAAYTYRLTHVRLRGVPAVELGGGGCVPSFALLNARGDKLFDYQKAAGGKLRRFRRGEPYADLDVTRWRVTLAGDVKLQFYHAGGMGGASKLAHLWVHTGFIARNYLCFGRHAVDKANKDKRGVFAPGFAVELYLHRVDEPPLPPLKAQAAAEVELAERERRAAAAAAAAAVAAAGVAHGLRAAMRETWGAPCASDGQRRQG